MILLDDSNGGGVEPALKRLLLVDKWQSFLTGTTGHPGCRVEQREYFLQVIGGRWDDSFQGGLEVLDVGEFDNLGGVAGDISGDLFQRFFEKGEEQFVLVALFGMLPEFILMVLVLLGIVPPGTGSGQGLGFDGVAPQFKESLRGGTDEGRIR